MPSHHDDVGVSLWLGHELERSDASRVGDSRRPSRCTVGGEAARWPPLLLWIAPSDAGASPPGDA